MNNYLQAKEMYDSGISIATIASKLRLPMMEVCVLLSKPVVQ